MLVLGLMGKARSGKDTVADILKNDYGFIQLAFADKVREYADVYFNWDGEKDDKGRRLLQEIGMAGRHYDENIWINKLRYILGKYNNNVNKIVISDVRFKNEYDYICSLDYGYIWKITGRGGLSGEVGQHESELFVDDLGLKFDAVIDNSRTLIELKDRVDTIVKAFI